MTVHRKPHMITAIVSSFLVDRSARMLSKTTIVYYEQELRYFTTWATGQGLETIEDVTTTCIRMYLLQLSEHRNPGGCHAAYRALRVFFTWVAGECDMPNDWRNPVLKVAPPKVSREPIAGISVEDIRKLLAGCDKTEVGQRDRAIILFLVDSGVRLSELLALNIEDVDLTIGAVMIYNGKGSKPRQVFVGSQTRREIQRYLRLRGGDPADDAPLFVIQAGTRLTRRGLEQMIRTRERRAGITTTGLHAFRRTFTIEMLRSGADILTISRLLGHSSIALVQRYARQTAEDLRLVHERSSPGDRLK